MTLHFMFVRGVGSRSSTVGGVGVEEGKKKRTRNEEGVQGRTSANMCALPEDGTQVHLA